MHEVINTPIDNSTWTEIKLNDNQNCQAFAIRARNGEDFMIKATLGSTAYWTVANGAEASIGQSLLNGRTVAYAKCVSAASEVVETIII